MKLFFSCKFDFAPPCKKVGNRVYYRYVVAPFAVVIGSVCTFCRGLIAGTVKSCHGYFIFCRRYPCLFFIIEQLVAFVNYFLSLSIINCKIFKGFNFLSGRAVLQKGAPCHVVRPQSVDKTDFSAPLVLLPSKRFSGAHFDTLWSVRRKTLNYNGF